MATTPIDLSAGLVPKPQPQAQSPIDLSAGLLNSTPAQPASPSWAQELRTGAVNLGKGVAKSGIQLMSTGDQWARQHLPAFMTNSDMGFGPPANERHVQEMAIPHGIAQAIGKGIGNAAQFLIPGGAEEEAATAGAKLAPWLGEAARPLMRVGAGALSSGAVNKMQGGSFGSGALAGGAGGAVGEGLRAIAPKIAESALGITKADRAFSRTPGRAILDETRGFRPSKIADTGQVRLGELTPELERAADEASVRHNPARGLLTAPAEEIPLAASVRPPKMNPMAFPARINPEEAMEPRSGNPMAPISEYPGINPHYLSGSEHPELSGRVPTNQGVLIRPAPARGGPIPTILSNPSASLSPARNVVGAAMGRATAENAESLHGQLGEMGDFLGRRFNTGEPIPENVTPRDLLNLKRGFSKEFLGRWNPETHGDTISTGRNAYRTMDQELDRTVPQAASLNGRISSLIPVVRRAESVSRNAPPIQMMMRRFAAPTGALIGSAAGGEAGYREGGVPGAVVGAAAGLAGPSLFATPEGWMTMARGANAVKSLRPLAGGLLQLNRPNDDGQ